MITRREMEEARKFLLEHGWEHIATISHSDKDINFGLLFTRRGERFYLNFHTIKDVENHA